MYKRNGNKTQKTNTPRPPALRAAGRGAGSRKKLVSRAALKGFIREMHGHARSRGEGGRGQSDFFRIFRSRDFWTVPK